MEYFIYKKNNFLSKKNGLYLSIDKGVLSPAGYTCLAGLSLSLDA